MHPERMPYIRMFHGASDAEIGVPDACAIAKRHNTMIAALDAPVPDNLNRLAWSNFRLPTKASEAA